MRRGILLMVLLAAGGLARGQASTLERLVSGTGATVVLLDVASGREFAKTGPMMATLPGSTLKPFVLLAGLEAGVVQPNTTVECRGTLTVDDHGRPRNLACTHPRSLTVFAARDALAYSCNTYFARLAAEMPAKVLRAGLSRFGLPASKDLVTPEARELVALGLRGERLTPESLARAYRQLALAPETPSTKVVRDGLLDGVRVGMADNAAVPGMKIAGKTGTASDPGEAWTHGWFAGMVYAAEKPERVIVVYIPRGSGADAATLAARVLGGMRL